MNAPADFSKLRQPLSGYDALEANLRRAAEEARGPFASVPKMKFPGNRMKNTKKLMGVISEGLDIMAAISELGWDAQGIQEVVIPSVPRSRSRVWAAYLTKLLSPEGLTAIPVGQERGRSPLRRRQDGILVHLKDAKLAYVIVNILSRQLLHIARVIACKQPTRKTEEGYSWIPKGLRHIFSAHGVPSARYGDFAYVNAANETAEFNGENSFLRDADAAFEGLRKIMRASYLPTYQSVEQLPLYGQDDDTK